VTYAISTMPPARRTERTLAAVDLRFSSGVRRRSIKPVAGSILCIAEGGNRCGFQPLLPFDYFCKRPTRPGHRSRRKGLTIFAASASCRLTVPKPRLRRCRKYSRQRANSPVAAIRALT